MKPLVAKLIFLLIVAFFALPGSAGRAAILHGDTCGAGDIDNSQFHFAEFCQGNQYLGFSAYGHGGFGYNASFNSLGGEPFVLKGSITNGGSSDCATGGGYLFFKDFGPDPDTNEQLICGSGSGEYAGTLEADTFPGEIRYHILFVAPSGSDFRVCFSIGGAGSGGPGDSDGDGLSDSTEQSITHTEPCNKDTDGDGLWDGWEAPTSVPGSGFDLDGNGAPDVSRDAVFGPYSGSGNGGAINLRRQPPIPYTDLNFPPDPLHKDLYIEIDWQDCLLGGCPELVGVALDPSHHAPNLDALSDVAAMFLNAPVDNPDGHKGVHLNILVDERTEHMPNCDQGNSERRASNFGTPEQQRQPLTMQAKDKAVRYMWSGHSTLRDNSSPDPCPSPSFIEQQLTGFGLGALPEYDLTPFGWGDPGGRDILASLGPIWVCQLYTFQVGSAYTLQPPCFRDTTLYGGAIVRLPGIFPAEIAVEGGGTIPWEQPIAVSLGIGPEEGARQVWGRAFANLLGQSLGLSSAQAGNDPNVNHPVESYGTWEGLNYDASGGANSASVASTDTPAFQPIFPDHHLLEVDADGDSIAEGADNCPGLANDQSDLDGDGRGDPCDADPDGDGKPNETDAMPLDSDDDGANNSIDEDDDNDGLPDSADNCALVANAAQDDTDSDGIGDACDLDVDGDGLPNPLENLLSSDPLDATSTLEMTDYGSTCSDGLDNDGDGNSDSADDGCIDGDGDTIPDTLDTCPAVSNHGNLDFDGDGHGDECDDDDDDDGFSDLAEQAARSDWLDSASKPALVADLDCSGQINGFDGIALLASLAGLVANQTQPCPQIGAGTPAFGDVNCDNVTNAADVIPILQFMIGLALSLSEPCPAPVASNATASLGELSAWKCVIAPRLSIATLR